MICIFTLKRIFVSLKISPILVVSKINTKPNLEFTCTLLYLLEYKSLYQEGTLNDFDTPSVNKCLNDPNFDQLVINFDYNNKIKVRDWK